MPIRADTRSALEVAPRAWQLNSVMLADLFQEDSGDLRDRGNDFTGVKTMFKLKVKSDFFYAEARRTKKSTRFKQLAASTGAFFWINPSPACRLAGLS
jgi:t-SNARE complex subunit (syntaxin)